jgi:hypothetical protein
MGYADVYRKRMNIWRRLIKWILYAAVFSIIAYFSLQLLSDNTGMMMGGTIGG